MKVINVFSQGFSESKGLCLINIFCLLFSHTFLPSSQATAREAGEETEYKLPDISLPAYHVEIKRDVAYLNPDRKEKCDLYFPVKLPENQRVPAIVIIHGGGWKAGDKADRREAHLGTMLARYGYVCMSINYLLSKGDSSSWPQNLYDCKSAVKFLRKNADLFQINDKQIGAIGGSAGGHLAAMLAVTDDKPDLELRDVDSDVSARIQAAVDLYGPANFTTCREAADCITGMLGATQRGNPELWKFASPINHITEDASPLLILHGLADKAVSYKQSISFLEALHAKNISCKLVLIGDAPHTIPMWSKYGDLIPVIASFFDKYLKSQQ